VIRGAIVVPAGSRCSAPLQIQAGTAYFQGIPRGCFGTHPEQAHFDLSYMRSFRKEFCLDEDLKGNQAAVNRRIRGLIRAWKRGEPVARVSAAEIGQPLRPADQRRLEFREELLDRTVNALERWVPKHAEDTYAGYAIDDEHGVILYVGFTGNQKAQLAAFERQMKPPHPRHIKPFPVPPLYSERALLQLEEEVFELVEDPNSPLGNLINSLSVLALPNKVAVGTEHVAEVKRLLAERFSPDAPFLVVYSEPAEPL
jgi:hypothetical protein